jgi:hypothetical protein
MLALKIYTKVLVRLAVPKLGITTEVYHLDRASDMQCWAVNGMPPYNILSTEMCNPVWMMPWEWQAFDERRVVAKEFARANKFTLREKKNG